MQVPKAGFGLKFRRGALGWGGWVVGCLRVGWVGSWGGIEHMEAHVVAVLKPVNDNIPHAALL